MVKDYFFAANSSSKSNMDPESRKDMGTFAKHLASQKLRHLLLELRMPRKLPPKRSENQLDLLT